MDRPALEAESRRLAKIGGIELTHESLLERIVEQHFRGVDRFCTCWTVSIGARRVVSESALAPWSDHADHAGFAALVAVRSHFLTLPWGASVTLRAEHDVCGAFDVDVVFHGPSAEIPHTYTVSEVRRV